MLSTKLPKKEVELISCCFGWSLLDKNFRPGVNPIKLKYCKIKINEFFSKKHDCVEKNTLVSITKASLSL